MLYTEETLDINKLKDIPFKKRANCVICGKRFNSPLLDLPGFPLTELYIDRKISERVGFADQAFYLCDNCGHGQLANAIDQGLLYDQNYSTRTSASSSAVGMLDSFLQFVDSLTKDRNIENIIEIGCNDLYTLKSLRDKAGRLYGIDPILKGKEDENTDEKVEVIGDFIENVDLKALGIEMDVVLCSHTLEHIEDPKHLIHSLIDHANPDTLFFFQFPGLELLIRNGRFDQIFHQHLNYFSLKSVIHMLEDAGAELIDFRLNPHHWGTIMIAFKKIGKASVSPNTRFKESINCLEGGQVMSQYKIFKDCMEIANRRILSFGDEKICGYGAALMLPALHYHLKELLKLEFIIDDDKNKDGLYYCNLPLEIVNSSRVDNIEDLVILITAINSKYTARAIISRLIDLKVKQIIMPINII